MSITAEKIEQIARIIDPQAWVPTVHRGDAQAALAKADAQHAALDKARAILSLLQQGEPEGYNLAPAETFAASPLPPAPGAETGAKEPSDFRTAANWLRSAAEWLERDGYPFVNSANECIEQALKILEPALPRSSSRQAVLEEAAKKVVDKATFHFSEHNRFAREGRSDLATLHMNRAFDYENLASEIRALATTPPAEGETK